MGIKFKSKNDRFSSEAFARAVILLHKEGVPLAEIAEALGCPGNEDWLRRQLFQCEAIKAQDMPATSLFVGVRAQRIIAELGCETVGDVAALTVGEILAIRGAGRGTLAEIGWALREEYGLDLGKIEA